MRRGWSWAPNDPVLRAGTPGQHLPSRWRRRTRLHIDDQPATRCRLQWAVHAFTLQPSCPTTRSAAAVFWFRPWLWAGSQHWASPSGALLCDQHRAWRLCRGGRTVRCRLGRLAFGDRHQKGALMGGYRVAMDIGGTFTDVVAYNDVGGIFTATKASTTPGNLSEGVLSGLASVVDKPTEIDFLVHGTTQGLNAFLERRGVPVLLLGTAGVEDSYHIARGPRTRLYDLHYRKPTPLVA